MNKPMLPINPEPQEPRPPNCPHCQKPMPIIALYPYQIGQMIIPTLACPWCAALLHIEILKPPAPAADAAPPDKSPIWKPS